MRFTTSDQCRTSRRGVALLVAISVLGILTILAMGLAASQQVTRDLSANQNVRAGALRGIQLGLDVAIAGIPKGLTEGRAAENADVPFSWRAEAATPEAACYAGEHLAPRPGDMMVTASGRSLTRKGSIVAERRYLVNLQPGTERRVCLAETISFESMTESVSSHAIVQPAPE
jgi:hypothetical protein